MPAHNNSVTQFKKGLTETHLILVVANKHSSRKDMDISKLGRVTFIHREMRIEISSDKPQEEVIYVPAQQHKHDQLNSSDN